jgi:hypothetical protein
MVLFSQGHPMLPIQGSLRETCCYGYPKLPGRRQCFLDYVSTCLHARRFPWLHADQQRWKRYFLALMRVSRKDAPISQYRGVECLLGWSMESSYHPHLLLRADSLAIAFSSVLSSWVGNTHIISSSSMFCFVNWCFFAGERTMHGRDEQG